MGRLLWSPTHPTLSTLTPFSIHPSINPSTTHRTPHTQQEIASLTVKKEQLQRSSEATARKRDALVAQIAALKEVCVWVG